MARRGIWWWKAEIGTLHDQKMEDLVDELGAAGVGVWFSAMCQLHSAINDGKPFLRREHLVRRVACDLDMRREDAEAALCRMAEIGLLDEDMWSEGKAVNERVARRYEEYQAKVGIAEKARAARSDG